MRPTIESKPGPVCFSIKFSSWWKIETTLVPQSFVKTEFWEHTGNLSPYIENEPVPSPLRKSPPDEKWYYFFKVTSVPPVKIYNVKSARIQLTLTHEIWYTGRRSYIIVRKSNQRNGDLLTL